MMRFQDLLMTFSSSNGNAGTGSNAHPTPIAQEPQTDPMGYEQFRAPLVNSTYYAPNYATLRISRTMPNDADQLDDDEEDPPEVPPLPSSPSLHHSPITTVASPMHYRSLQSTPAISPKSKMINLGNYFPRVATDPPNRKRYHTAPREKQRVSIAYLLHYFFFTFLNIYITFILYCDRRVFVVVIRNVRSLIIFADNYIVDCVS